MTRETFIGDKTYVPITFAAVFIATIAGGIVWLTTIYSLGQANQTAIADLKIKSDTYVQTVQNIDHRLSRIEGKLGVNE